MDDLFKSVRYYILVGYLALMAFLAVFYYDKPVHRDFAVYMSEVCVDTSLDKTRRSIRGNRAATMQLLKEPIMGYCDCFMPSPRNQMTYLNFAQNYWENLSLSLHLGAKATDYRAVKACAAEFRAAVGLLSQYHDGDVLPGGKNSDLQ